MNTADTARRLYAAMHDPALLADLVTPDVVLHDPGTHPLGGDHHGPAGVAAFLAASAATGKTTEVVEVLGADAPGADGWAAVYCRVRAEHDGDVLDNHTVHLLRIAGGRVAEVWFHNRDQVRVDRFFERVLPVRTGAS